MRLYPNHESGMGQENERVKTAIVQMACVQDKEAPAKALLRSRSKFLQPIRRAMPCEQKILHTGSLGHRVLHIKTINLWQQEK